VLRADSPGVAPVTDPYSAVVLQMDRAHVDTVLVDGVVHRHHGRSTRDTTLLLQRARTVLDRLAGIGALHTNPPRSER
jgi:cytosine/adenosine deaminase-related metal-dependent hydrolase